MSGRVLSCKPSSERGAVLKIAYLVNQYPKVSHSFIRREILALERQGLNVLRIAVRGWGDVLVDEDDQAERVQTRYVLKEGPLPLLGEGVKRAFCTPLRFSSALALAFRMGWRAERSLPLHLIYLAEACRILSWLEREGVQHLHAHFGTNSAEVAMLVHALGGPGYSFTVHGPEEFDKPAFIGLGEKIRRARFVVAISSFGASQLRRWVGHESWPKIRVVHCGLESSFYADAPVSLSSAPRLVCVGRLCEQKGQLLLLEAAARLHAAGQVFELVLAGDGEMRPQIEALIEQHSLSGIVRITGWISSAQVRDELLAARAMVLPSFAEGLPVVIMEAMALRRPVLSTYVAGIPELVVPGETGWLVPAGDVEALALAMRAALEAEDEHIHAMGEAGYARVVQRHSIDTEAAKLAAFFAKAVPVDEVVL